MKFDENNLNFYAKKFQKLTQGVTQYGKAPHKPILLLTFIELFEKKLLLENKVTISSELVALFKENFALLVKTPHKDDFTQPFYYLQSEKFWHLISKDDTPITTYIRSVYSLNEILKYGYFDTNLFELFNNEYCRIFLKNILLETYFSNTKNDFLKIKNSGKSYLDSLENYILNEKEPTYTTIPPQLDDEDTKFVRGGLFKKIVPKVYNFTCAISEMRLIANDGSTMIEACHIKPFSKSGDDRVTNGIALCPNLHTAFDKGLIGISTELKVIVSSCFSEDSSSPFNIRQFHNKPIILPFGDIHYPSVENFK